MKQGRSKSSFRLTDGHMLFEKMLNWRQSTKKYEGQDVLRSDFVKDDILDLMQYSLNKIISITNDSGKSHGYHFSRLPGCAGQELQFRRVQQNQKSFL